jgi:hypothetical protein
MRKLLLIPVAGLAIFSACNSTRKPNAANFTAAIDQYLDRHGQVCALVGPQFPVDVPRSRLDDSSGRGAKLTALQRAGLVSETDTTAVVHGLLDSLRGPSPPQPVRHYALTSEGQKYLQLVSGAVIPTSGFCYGQKIVDSITHWTVGSPSAAEVTYTYHIVNLAAWAQRPEIQQAFPDVQATISGASEAKQVVGLQLTDKGWEVP